MKILYFSIIVPFWDNLAMTPYQIALAAVVAGTCWIWILKLTIDHAANRIIKQMDELGKTLEKVESKIR